MLIQWPFLGLALAALATTQEAVPSPPLSNWDQLEAEYTLAVESWAQDWARQLVHEPGTAPKPFPTGDYWERYAEQERAGEIRGLLWQLRHLQAPGLEVATRRECAQRALATLVTPVATDWKTAAIPLLMGSRDLLEEAQVMHALESLALEDAAPALRRQALLGLGAIAQAQDAAMAFQIYLDAFSEPTDTLDHEHPSPKDLDALMRRIEAYMALDDSSHFDQWYVEVDGAYYAKPGAPEQARSRLQPLVQEFVRRGSPQAARWYLAATWTRADEDPLVALAFNTLTSAELDSETLSEFAWSLDGLVRRLGAHIVEPKVLALIERAQPEDQASLLFALGVGLCEDAAAERPAQRERGLALLQQVVQKWPESASAKDAAGRIFRFTQLTVGQTAPDFETLDVDGNKFRLSDYRGKITVIDFWGFW